MQCTTAYRDQTRPTPDQVYNYKNKKNNGNKTGQASNKKNDNDVKKGPTGNKKNDDNDNKKKVTLVTKRMTITNKKEKRVKQV